MPFVDSGRFSDWAVSLWCVEKAHTMPLGQLGLTRRTSVIDSMVMVGLHPVGVRNSIATTMDRSI